MYTLWGYSSSMHNDTKPARLKNLNRIEGQVAHLRVDAAIKAGGRTAAGKI